MQSSKHEVSRETYENQINYVMGDFPFESVLNYMTAVDWKWRNQTVTLQMLKEQAMDLLLKVTTREDMSNVSCGGLTATRSLQHGTSALSLSFVITSTSYVCSK